MNPSQIAHLHFNIPQAKSKRQQKKRDECLSRIDAAKHPSELSDLAFSNDPEIRVRLARSVKCQPRLLAKLASDPDERVRLAVCRNTKTPTETLRKLWNTQDKAWLAANYSLPIELIEEAMSSKDKEVRALVATNRKLSAAQCAVLVQDPAWVVREGVAENPSLSVDDALILARDPQVDVRIRLALCTKSTVVLSEMSGGIVIMGGLRSKIYPEDEDDRVLANIARNSKTDASALKRLSKVGVWSKYYAVLRLAKMGALSS